MSLHEDLKAYIDGELDPRRAEEIRAALETDSVLQKEYGELRALSTAFACTPKIEAIGLEATLLSLQKSKPRRRIPWHRIAWSGGLVLAAALVMFVVLPILSHRSMDEASDVASVAEKAGSTQDDQMKKAQEPINGLNPSAGMSASATPSGSEAKHVQVMTGMGGRSNTNERNGTPEQSMRTKATVPSTMGAKVLSAQPDQVAKVPSDGTVTTMKASKKLAVAQKKGQSIISPDMRLGSSATATMATSTLSKNGFSGQLLEPTLPSPQTVVLTFDSQDNGEKQVLAVVGKYAIKNDVKTRIMADSVKIQASRTIVIDVPEDLADKTIHDLRQLPTTPTVAFANTLDSSSASTMTAQAPGGASGAPANASGRFRGAGANAGGRVGGAGGGGFGGGFGVGGGAVGSNSPRAGNGDRGALPKVPNKLADTPKVLETKSTTSGTVTLGKSSAANNKSNLNAGVAVHSSSNLSAANRLKQGRQSGFSKNVNKPLKPLDPAGAKFGLTYSRGPKMRRIVIVLIPKTKQGPVPVP